MTPATRRAGRRAEPGPLYSTAPSTSIMHGIMGAASSRRQSISAASGAAGPISRPLAAGVHLRPSHALSAGSASGARGAR